MSADAHGVARDQLRAFIERIERLEEEKKTIADDIKDVYGEAKSMGYDTKIMKKVVALRKIDDQKRTEDDLVLDTYLGALGMIPQFEMFNGDEVKPSRDARRRQRTTEAMDDHKSLVDEMADAGLISEEARHENKALADAVATKFGNGPAQALQSPRKAAEAVAEMPRTNPVANVEEGATGAIAAASNDPASRTDENGERQHSSTVGFTGDCRTEGKEQSDASAASVGDAAADAHGIPVTNSDIAPASQGEAEAPSVESEEPGILAEDTRSDANTGGEDVTPQNSSAQHQAGGLVKIPPAKHPALILRPHCQHPGEEICGGSGKNHCRACAAAIREEEVA